MTTTRWDSTIAALQAETGMVNGEVALVAGYSATDDGSTGMMYFNTSVGGKATISAVAGGTPVTITTTLPHGLSAGVRVLIGGVNGLTPSINGFWIVTNPSGNTFQLSGSNSSGTYSGTGTIGDGGQSFPSNSTTAGQWYRVFRGYVSVKDYGAVGDGVTDDRPAIVLAVAEAMASRRDLLFPVGGRYKISKYIDVLGARKLHVLGYGATLLYPSDDTTVGTDSIANSISKARSALLMRYCRDVTIEGLTFEGGTKQDLTNANTGSAVYSTRSIGVHMVRCIQRFGYSIFQADATPGTSGTGTSIAVSSGVVTVTINGAPFTAGHVDGTITLSNCNDSRNDGEWRILSYLSTTQVTIANPAAQNETSSFKYLLDDDDRTIHVERCTSYWVRGGMHVPSNSVVRHCHWEYPRTHDRLGIGDSFTTSGGIVTLTDNAAPFDPSIAGKRIIITGSATNNSDNSGWPITYISSTQISWSNTTGQSEAYTGTWWIPNGDRVGIGAGAGAIAKQTPISATFSISPGPPGSLSRTSGSFITDGFVVGGACVMSGFTNTGNNTQKTIASVSALQLTFTDNTGLVTENGTAAFATYGTLFTSAAAAFDTSNVGDSFRIYGATTTANNGSFVISGYVSSTQIQFVNTSAVSEAFSKIWTMDSYDRVSSLVLGSSHAIYIFGGGGGGREGITIDGCTFANNHVTCVKFSASDAPIRGIRIINCKAWNCGAFATIGADDVNEHTDIYVAGNEIYDCATGRAGYWGGTAIGFLGSRNVTCVDNQFYYTRPAVYSMDGTGIGALAGIVISRYVAGISQPCENFVCQRNTFTRYPGSTASGIIQTAIQAKNVGEMTRWRTGGSIAMSGSTATITDASAEFSPVEMVGQTITIVNSTDAGNNGSFTITAATSTTVQFTNASGVTRNPFGGTYRIAVKYSVGGADISHNQIHHVAVLGIVTTMCVGPELTNNVFSGVVHNFKLLGGDVTPRIAMNKEIGRGTTNAGAAIWMVGCTTSWPIIYDNTITNQAIGPFATHGFSVSVDGTNAADFPLLGKVGRLRPTNAQEEVVFAYGANLVDGDTLTLNDGTNHVFTYKSSSPVAANGQFNTFNTDDASHVGLCGRIAAIGGGGVYTAADYGTGFAAGDVATQHVRVRKVAQTSSDGTFYVTVSALNPQALVLLRNNDSPSSSCKSRGAGTLTGSVIVPDGSVAWTPLATFAGGAALWPDNDTARQMLALGTAATGTIQCVAKASINDGETVTVNDGFRSVTYEFDTTGVVTPGNVRVDISGATTASDVSAVLRPLISSNQPSMTVADGGSGLINLTHNWAGPGGNATITKTVANAGFTVSGLAGGAKGGWRTAKNSVDSGCCEVIKHAALATGAEFRWVYE